MAVGQVSRVLSQLIRSQRGLVIIVVAAIHGVCKRGAAYGRQSVCSSRLPGVCPFPLSVRTRVLLGLASFVICDPKIDASPAGGTGTVGDPRGEAQRAVLAYHVHKDACETARGL